jgi:hypothetical protein
VCKYFYSLVNEMLGTYEKSDVKRRVDKVAHEQMEVYLGQKQLFIGTIPRVEF